MFLINKCILRESNLVPYKHYFEECDVLNLKLKFHNNWSRVFFIQ